MASSLFKSKANVGRLRRFEFNCKAARSHRISEFSFFMEYVVSESQHLM